MGMASIEAHEILKQKQDYWIKILSDEGAWTTLSLLFNEFDWLSYFSDWVLSDTLWSSLVSMLLLSLPALDIEPINLVWDIELPTPEEFARGIRIKLVKKVIEDLVPECKDVIEDITKIFEEDFAEQFKETRLVKGYYDRTQYNTSYYDPTEVYELIRSTLYALMKKDITLNDAREKIDVLAKILEIHPEVKKILFNKLSAISAVKEQVMVWDYGWWDKSYWGDEEGKGWIRYIDYDLQEKSIEFEDMVDLIMGGHFDEASWDYFFWVGESGKEAHPFKDGKCSIAYIYDKLWANFRNMVLTTALAVANYQRREEMEKWTRSERLETFSLPVTQRMYLERLVASIVRKHEPNIDVFRLRLYKSAVLQIFGIKGSPHRWGEDTFRAMTEEDFKQWWIETWERKGLRRETLEDLYDSLKKQIDIFINRRYRERFRFLSKRLFTVR